MGIYPAAAGEFLGAEISWKTSAAKAAFSSANYANVRE